MTNQDSRNCGLSKRERLKRENDFKLVYSTGKSFISPKKKVKALCLIRKNEEKPSLKVAFAVSKRAGKAVWRTRVKRLMRDSYRLNKTELLNKTSGKNVLVYIVFVAFRVNQKNNKKIGREIFFNEIEFLLNKITSRL